MKSGIKPVSGICDMKSGQRYFASLIAVVCKTALPRVKCEDCGHEYLVAFSCKRRHFCPSCHQKRVVEFGEWFLDELAVTVPHRHIIFSIPKLIRRCFMFDRKLLADLSRIAWETLKEYTSTPFYSAQDRSLSAGTTLPGCACSIQTFGDFLGFNPHWHIIISDGTFDEAGNFRITPYYDAHALEQLFRHKLLKMLLGKGVITQWHIDLLMVLLADAAPDDLLIFR